MNNFNGIEQVNKYVDWNGLATYQEISTCRTRGKSEDSFARTQALQDFLIEMVYKDISMFALCF